MKVTVICKNCENPVADIEFDEVSAEFFIFHYQCWKCKRHSDFAWYSEGNKIIE